MHMAQTRRPEVTLAIATPCGRLGVRKNPSAVG